MERKFRTAEPKFEDIKDIDYGDVGRNKPRIEAYKNYRRMVNTLLHNMDCILHEIADEVDPDGEVIYAIGDYVNESWYHTNIPAEVYEDNFVEDADE